jgi:hypothetical protein
MDVYDSISQQSIPLLELSFMPMPRSLLWILLSAGFLPAADPISVPFGKKSAPVPKEWKSEKPDNRLRSHQFKLSGDDSSLADAELYVMPESNPKSEQYFPRWKSSMTPPEGKTEEDITTISKVEIPGGVVHLLDMTGTWSYRARPFDPSSKADLRPDYRVVWAIVVTGDEASHLRLSGPKRVVDKHYDSFIGWLKSLK